MSDYPTCHQPMPHLSIRIPISGPLQVEHACQTWGCRDRLVPVYEDANDPEAALASIFRKRGANVTVVG